MDSWSEAIRTFPKLWKVLVAVAAVLASVATSAGSFALYHQGMATDAEVAAEVDKHNRAPRVVSDIEKSPHPEYDRELRAIRAELMKREREERAQRRRDAAVFEHLVSLHAADLEPDRKRKADAAAFARNAYRDAMASGVEPEVAADRAIDARPPWRR